MSYDRVQETWTGTGTGTVTLSGTASSGFRALADAVPNASDFEYTILHDNGTEWETGQGLFSSGTLTRARVHASSNSGALVNFSAGNKRIFGNCPAGRWILADTTLYLATTGSDTTGDGSATAPWATIARALRFLRDRWIASDATVTIQLADGLYTMTAPVEIAHPCGSRLAILGEHTYAKTMSVVVSSSGGSGAWSLVLQLNNVTDIAVGDYVLVTAASAGTNPLYTEGCHEVTNVDSGNSRITVTSKAIKPFAAEHGGGRHRHGPQDAALLECRNRRHRLRPPQLAGIARQGGHPRQRRGLLGWFVPVKRPRRYPVERLRRRDQLRHLSGDRQLELRHLQQPHRDGLRELGGHFWLHQRRAGVAGWLGLDEIGNRLRMHQWLSVSQYRRLECRIGDRGVLHDRLLGHGLRLHPRRQFGRRRQRHRLQPGGQHARATSSATSTPKRFDRDGNKKCSDATG